MRYRAAKSLDTATVATFRDLIPTKLAAGVWNCLMKNKKIKDYPQSETCELLILDRSIDQVLVAGYKVMKSKFNSFIQPELECVSYFFPQIAPIIHEWTYDAMCRDLLNMDGNKYVHEVRAHVFLSLIAYKLLIRS